MRRAASPAPAARQVNDAMTSDVTRDDIRHGATKRRQGQQDPAAPDTSSALTRLPSGAKPKRQLRRVGVKIGRKVLEFQRPLFRLGPLHVYRTAAGRLSIQWKRPKR